MSKNKTVVEYLDLLINQAEEIGLYIEYIAVGPSLMKTLSEEISASLDGLLIKSLAKYRDISLRETEVDSIIVKYLVDKAVWDEITHG